MSTLCKTYSDEGEARAAVERLLAEGAPHRGIRLLTGLPLHDVRAERLARSPDRSVPTRRSGNSRVSRAGAVKGPAPSRGSPIASARARSPTSSATWMVTDLAQLDSEGLTAPRQR